jgi:hypothetical protein
MSATLTPGRSLGRSRGVKRSEGSICTIGRAAANRRVRSDGIGHRLSLLSLCLGLPRVFADCGQERSAHTGSSDLAIQNVFERHELPIENSSFILILSHRRASNQASKACRTSSFDLLK